MIHIDEQISQIYNILSPLYSSSIDNPSPILNITELPSIPHQSSPLPSSLSFITATTPSETNVNTPKIPSVFETTSFYSDINTKTPFFDPNQQLSSTITDVHDVSLQSRTNESLLPTSSIHQSTNYNSLVLSTPPPPSIFNRSASSSIVSLGISTTPRGSVSNKIVPAPPSPPSTSPKQSLTTSFQPVSNTRFNPGRSPKPKARSYQNRSNIKHQQQSEKVTTIELESSTQEDITNKNVPLLSTSSSSSSTAKSGSNIFRRFLTGGSNTEKTTISSSTLLYDDEHPISPSSSGNDDDDYQPLTSSSSKHQHQTPL